MARRPGCSYRKAAIISGVASTSLTLVSSIDATTSNTWAPAALGFFPALFSDDRTNERNRVRSGATRPPPAICIKVAPAAELALLGVACRPRAGRIRYRCGLAMVGSDLMREGQPPVYHDGSYHCPR